MTYGGVDHGRRRFLTATTAVVGAVGAAYSAVPFVASWAPSARAKAIGAPVEVDLSKLESGQLMRVKWRGKPVWILRRTEHALASLSAVEDKLRDPASGDEQQPAYARNKHRSVTPDVLVLVGLCTHLGCSPTIREVLRFWATTNSGPIGRVASSAPATARNSITPGRVYAGVPAPTNLVVPPHTLSSPIPDLLIGVDPQGGGVMQALMLTGLLDWTDARFPLTKMWNEHLAEYYAPKNFNFWYYFGSLAMLVLVIQILTGIWLTMNYKPDAAARGVRFGRVHHARRELGLADPLPALHGRLFFLHRGLSAHVPRLDVRLFPQAPRELHVGHRHDHLPGALMAEAFMGYLLPWGQMSFWGAQVIISLFGAHPGGGPRTWRCGSAATSSSPTRP